MSPTQPLKQQFISMLKALEHRRARHTVFSDWLEIAALSMHQLPYHSGELPKGDAFQALEQQYFERIKPYSREELTLFSKLLALTITAHHHHYGDFLGEVAGECEVLNKRSGQFFTPYPLCRAIAKMLMGDVRLLVAQKGLVTACEPAVGAGGLVIASAEEIASQGVDPRACIQFDCTDISRDAFNMAYIQLSALGLQAVVRHGNTLSDEMWASRPTPQRRLFDQWLQAKQSAARRVQAMRDVLSEASSDLDPATRETSRFETDPFTVAQPTQQRQQRQRADIVLDRQMELFSDV